MTLAAMIPSAVGRHLPRSEAVAHLAAERGDWPPSLGARQRRILDELYEARLQGVEPLTVERLLQHAEASRDSLHRLTDRKLIRIEHRPVTLPTLSDDGAEPDFQLNDDQRAVLDELAGPLEGGFTPILLHGVTGSGKTEIYIQAIRRVLAAGKQAMLLVPEIALAAQTLDRLVKRLPRVAVLHSGLTDAERAFHYDQIARGHADVIIGPRSAVFAPAPKLGLIVVDEEHEPSYKQDTAPRYHGRDVAIKRASLEDIPVVLGSATPSMESFYNASQGRYRLLKLARRVRGLPMPRLNIVSLRKEMTAGKIELIGRTLTLKMAGALDRREQIILLMNRRGYASYVFCPKCQWVQCCGQCTRALVFHQATALAMCHYCQSTEALPSVCPACGGKIVLFGWGIQRIENELGRKFPQARLARMDSDTMTSPKQFQQVFEQFGSGELDILLGTQMVAKGLDFPRVSLVGVVSADTSLAIPDFRADERTFQLVTQVAGRAGRAGGPGDVVVQTLQEHHPAILSAAAHDYEGFAQRELKMRSETRLPPFGRVVRLVVRHADVDKASHGAEVAARHVRALLAGDDVRMLGPQPAAVMKVRNLFRFQMLLISDRPGLIQQRLAGRLDAIMKETPAELLADADPLNLL
jgi:primosomal protein N' (replication factor Y)